MDKFDEYFVVIEDDELIDVDDEALFEMSLKYGVTIAEKPINARKMINKSNKKHK